MLKRFGPLFLVLLVAWLPLSCVASRPESSTDSCVVASAMSTVIGDLENGEAVRFKYAGAIATYFGKGTADYLSPVESVGRFRAQAPFSWSVKAESDGKVHVTVLAIDNTTSLAGITARAVSCLVSGATITFTLRDDSKPVVFERLGSVKPPFSVDDLKNACMGMIVPAAQQKFPLCDGVGDVLKTDADPLGPRVEPTADPRTNSTSPN